MPVVMVDDDSALRDAKPVSGDLVDRVLEAKLRARLFGTAVEPTLGRLRLEGVLGRGGMGSIISAFDPVLDRHVAVKSLHTGADDRDQLLREARLLAKLSHANVVPVYDVIEDAGGAYLVMERVAGGNLRTWMTEPHGWRDVVALFIQIGHGLSAAHALGIVHSDVKPENVVVSDGRPRLIDFGLAGHATDATRSRAGTRAYLAPERVAGQASSPAADQYAFFASLSEALGEARRAAWLDKAIRRGMDPDPAKRFPTMTAAVAALDRTSSIVKIAVAATLAAVVALAVVIVVQRRAARDDTCTGSDTLVAQAWSPPRRFTLIGAFAGTGAPNASAIAMRVATKLDRYAADWVGLRTQSCVATRVQKTQSEQLLDRSIACFDRQLVALASITQLLATPDRRIVSRAEPMLGELGDLASCTDPTRLAQAIALPADPAQRERIHELTVRFEAARNLERRGDHKGALAATDAVLADARVLGFSPLTARVLLLRGAVQATLADPKSAEATFREAATAAAQAHEDRLVAEIWTRVLELLAQQGRFEEALTLEPVAQASAERVADELAISARLSNTLGGIYLAKARYQDAYRAYDKAFALQRQIGPDGNPAYTPALGNLGLAKWYAGDPRGALVDLNEALTRMTAELGPDHSSLAYVHQNVADIRHQLGEVADAIPHYRETIRIWTASLGPDHPNLAYPYEQLALVGKAKGDFAAAREAAAQALVLRERGLGPEHPLVAQTLTVVAELELAQAARGDLPRADAAIRRALAILDKHGEAGRRQRGYVLDARARLAALRGDLPGALRDHRAALALTIELLGPEHRDAALGHVRVAVTQARLGDLPGAGKSYALARAIFDRYPDVNVEDAISAFVDYAAIELRLGRRAEARALLSAAHTRATTAQSSQLPQIEAALRTVK
jgi:tetratricopeptide (TPR) repeat protein/predicted Ser/Thr protein kinase